MLELEMIVLSSDLLIDTHIIFVDGHERTAINKCFSAV